MVVNSSDMKALDQQSRPLLSAVIVNYNSGPIIVEAIEAVLASALPVEVIVSDNASTDWSPELVGDLAARDSRVRVIRNAENLGFARANNIGLEQGAGDYLLVLNPDCVLQPGTLETMVEALRADPQVGMAGCLIENPDGSEQPGCRRSIPTPLSSLATFSHLDRMLPRLAPEKQVHLNKEPLPSRPVFVEAISGAFMLIRREAMDDVGLFDDGYFLHCEDLDWCARFSLHGWKILFVPQARAVHFKGTCSKDRPLFVLWHKHKGMVRFFRKFQYGNHALPFNWLVIGGIWSRFALMAVLNLLGEGARALVRPFRRPSPRVQALPFGEAAIKAEDALPLPDQLRGKRVLVTGGTGFIGRHLVRALCSIGAHVVVLSRHADNSNVRGFEGIEVRTADLTVPAATRGICEGIDVVFHLASHAHALDEGDAQGAELHRLVTTRGAELLLEDALACGVRCLVFLSSVKAMGEGQSEPADESHIPEPTSAYGRAKLAAERTLLEGARRGELVATVLRLPMVYGPGSKGNLPRMIDAIARGRFPPWPKLDNHRSVVHVLDVVRAALTVACHPRVAEQVYIVCEDKHYSTRWLYEQISQALGKRLPRWYVPYWMLRLVAAAGTGLERLIGRKVPLDKDALDKLAGDARYSTSKIRSELGFHSVHSLADEIPRMVQEYMQDRSPEMTSSATRRAGGPRPLKRGSPTTSVEPRPHRERRRVC